MTSNETNHTVCRNETDAKDIVFLVSLWKPVNVVQILFGLVGVFGNMLVCITILRKKSLQNLTNYFIASLAVTDMISSLLWVVSVFSRLILPSTDPRVRHFQCVAVEAGYVFWISVLASTNQLVAITLERLCAIVYPVKHRLFFTRRWAAVGIAISWLLPCLLLINFPLFHKVVDGECAYSTTRTAALVHGTVLFLFTYLIPLFTMTWAYVRIWQSLKTTPQNTTSGASLPLPGTQSSSRDRVRRKVIEMTLIVFVTFVVCWTPDQLMVFLHNIGLASFKISHFLPVQILALCNSCANPFIYAFKNKQFREGFREVFFCRSNSMVESNRVGPSTVSSELPRRLTSTATVSPTRPTDNTVMPVAETSTT